jgi:hypothetical protein
LCLTNDPIGEQTHDILWLTNTQQRWSIVLW